MNYTGLSFHNKNLSRLDLNHATMINVNMTGSTLNETILDYANMEDAIMTTTVIENVDIYSAYMPYINFDHATFTNVTLTNCFMRNANLRNSVWKDCCLQYLDLEGADLTGASFIDCIFFNLNLKDSIRYLDDLNNTHTTSSSALFRIPSRIQTSHDKMMMEMNTMLQKYNEILPRPVLVRSVRENSYREYDYLL
jgi:uncharacterized protein YjbI with pentapeptide repeats